VLQAWDFGPGSNFVVEMDKASKKAIRTIAVLSSDYLSSSFTLSEWASAFREDPSREKGTLVPIRVRECEDKLRGLLASIIYIDLVGLEGSLAHDVLLKGIRSGRGKPEIAPGFPGGLKHLANEQPRFPAAFPSIWNVPYRHNPLFADRRDILELLHDRFRADNDHSLIEPQMISGPGGIGKTRIATEYAFRYRGDYQAVLWANADSQEVLTLSFITFADLLKLPKKLEQDQRRVITAFMRWLKDQTHWLLILDNADDLTMVENFIPTTSRGHILLTTRAKAMRTIGQRIEITTMKPEEGALLLLRRATIIYWKCFARQRLRRRL
jgi:hypothetical protein